LALLNNAVDPRVAKIAVAKAYGDHLQWMQLFGVDDLNAVQNMRKQCASKMFTDSTRVQNSNISILSRPACISPNVGWFRPINTAKLATFSKSIRNWLSNEPGILIFLLQ